MIGEAGVGRFHLAARGRECTLVEQLFDLVWRQRVHESEYFIRRISRTDAHTWSGSLAHSHLVQMGQQVGRVGVHPVGSGAHELLFPVST